MLADVVALKKLPETQAAKKRWAMRIWERIASLGDSAPPEPAVLQGKNGATISDIMEAMGWLRNTVRGFMAGAMRKAGYTVESFKPEGGQHSYRLPK
jgi:Protein of unknown function (DUF3489)